MTRLTWKCSHFRQLLQPALDGNATTAQDSPPCPIEALEEGTRVSPSCSHDFAKGVLGENESSGYVFLLEFSDAAITYNLVGVG